MNKLLFIESFFSFKGDYKINKFVLDESRFPQQIPNGKYVIKVQMMKFGKAILSLAMKFTLKPSNRSKG